MSDEVISQLGTETTSTTVATDKKEEDAALLLDDDEDVSDEEGDDSKDDIRPITEDIEKFVGLQALENSKEGSEVMPLTKGQLFYIVTKKWVQFEDHDILDQCGARDLVLIDGFAIFERIIRNTATNKSYVDWRNGGEFLHVTYELEKFIKNLTDRTVQLEVVFFNNDNVVSTLSTKPFGPTLEEEDGLKDQRELYIQSKDANLSNSELLARQLIIQHLKHKMGITVHIFDSWFSSSQFEMLLLKSRPSLFIGSPSTLLLMYQLTMANEIMYAMDVRFEASSVHAFASHHFYKSPLPANYVSSLKEIIKGELATAKSTSTAIETDKALLESVQTTFSKIQGSEGATKLIQHQNGKMRLALQALTQQLSKSQQPKIDFVLAQVFMLCQILQTSLPLKYRAQEMRHIQDALDSSYLLQFLESVYGYATAIFTQEDDLHSSVSPYALPWLYDFIDGRLFLKLCYFLAAEDLNPSKSQLLSVDLPADIKTAFESVQSVLNSSISKPYSTGDKLEESWLQKLLKQSKQQTQALLAKLKQDYVQSDYKLVPVHTELVDSYLGEWNNTLASLSEEELESFEPASELFLLKNDWQGKELEDEASLEPKSKWQKRKLEETQKRLHKYATSLGNINERKIITTSKSVQPLISNRAGEATKRESELAGIKESLTAISKAKLDKILSRKKKEILEMNERGVMENATGISLALAEVAPVLQRIYALLQKQEAEIYVKAVHVPVNTKEEDLKSLFETVGIKNDQRRSVKSVTFETEEVQEKKKGAKAKQATKTALVYFSSKVEAKSAEKALNNYTIEESKIQTTMKEITISEEELNAIYQLQFSAYGLLLDCLFKQIEYLGVRTVVAQRPAEEHFWFIFEVICVAYELTLGIEEIQRDMQAKAEIEKASSKKKQEKPAKKTKKKASISIARVLDAIIASMVEFGFVQEAEKIYQKHKVDYDDLVFEPKRSKTKRSNVQLQLLYNSVYRSAQQYLPAKPPVYKSKNPNMYNLGFVPDPWQVDLIDYVEENKSVLVTAPTSSGKTFIAFYVVEKILRQDDEGVVVFVFPTKALVNQAFAEIYSRFTKNYKNDDQKMLGMYTASDRINVMNSQVLMCVPACLEQLLLSPSATEWRRKLRYVILDEIHCINSSEGSVWEHILLMIDSPFLALSATIGNAEEFKEWLNTNKKNVELVKHEERPRPLEYSVFNPLDKQVVELHPCAVLNPYNVDAREIIHIPPFSPQQALELFRVAEKVCGKEQNILKEFDPETYAPFKETIGIASRSTVHQYSKAMKDKLEALSKQPETHETLLKIFEIIRKPVDASFERIYTAYGKRIDSVAYLQKHFVDMVVAMREQKLLPTLMFSFDRLIINKLMKVLVEYVKTNKFNLWLTDAERAKALSDIRLTTSDLKEGGAVGEEFLEALELGVAVHYTGMPEDYQKEVERLFRAKQVPVIISTATLALGIHMPCKTVVICGYSQYLHSMALFAQCSGRSGRRGFDTKGRVLLFGIPQANINRLMTEGSPKIMGSLGLETTFILRLMMLHYLGSLKNPEAKHLLTQECKRLLEQPLFCLGNSLLDTSNQIKQHFRFMVEFLVREGYLRPNGATTDISGMPTYMAYNAPNNFILDRFIFDGLFHKLAGMPEEVADDQFLRVMSYLFCPVKVHPTNILARKLGPLPEDFQQSFNGLKNRVLEVVKNYVTTYGKTNPGIVKDNVLPFTKIAFNGEPSVEGSAIASLLKGESIEFNATSSFAALSGNDDQFTDLKQLLATIKHTIILDNSIIPFRDLNEYELNSFIVDFYRHGTLNRSMEENQIFSKHVLKRYLEQTAKEIRKIVSALDSTMTVPSSTDKAYLFLKDTAEKFYVRYVGKREFKRWMKRRANIKVGYTMDDQYAKGTSREDKKWGEKVVKIEARMNQKKAKYKE